MAARSERSGSGKSGPRAAERRGLLPVGGHLVGETKSVDGTSLIASAPCACYRCCYCSALLSTAPLLYAVRIAFAALKGRLQSWNKLTRTRRLASAAGS